MGAGATGAGTEAAAAAGQTARAVAVAVLLLAAAPLSGSARFSENPGPAAPAPAAAANSCLCPGRFIPGGLSRKEATGSSLPAATEQVTHSGLTKIKEDFALARAMALVSARFAATVCVILGSMGLYSYPPPWRSMISLRSWSWW